MLEQLVGIDWGSSNRRAYLVDREGHCLRTHEDDFGLLSSVTDFPASLQALLKLMEIGPGVPVIMSGMVGSAGGWQVAPYLDPSTSLDVLPYSLMTLPSNELARDCMIVPGYCFRGEPIDVMRGEETQLFGAVALGKRNGMIVLPGTHCKWVQIDDARISRWSTYMTGELFSMLGRSGTLATLMEDTGVADDDAFGEGIELARRRLPLSNLLFGVRARVVSGAMPATKARDFVSGLLIGAEFVAADEDCDEITLIGSQTLCLRYEQAAKLFGMKTSLAEPHALYCAALVQFLRANNSYAS